MEVTIINGPNLNLLGKREPGVYGNQDFVSYFESLKKNFDTDTLHYYQTNVEGEIINKIFKFQLLVLKWFIYSVLVNFFMNPL